MTEEKGKDEGGTHCVYGGKRREKDGGKEARLRTLSLFSPRPRVNGHKSLDRVIRGTEVVARVYNTPKSWSELIKILLLGKQRERELVREDKSTTRKEQRDQK